MQISFYQTNINLLFQAICKLLEKCYAGNLKTIVKLNTVELIEELDKLLWTYSRKGFLPHGTKNDKLPELQPIYITDSLENPNNASVLMLINPLSTDATKNLMNFSRVIIVYNENDADIAKQMINLQADLSSTNQQFDIYKQITSGAWLRA